MFRARWRWLVVALALSPCLAAAEPIKLKLAFIGSDRELIYSALVKPFLDAVNAEAKGVLEIQTFATGALGRVSSEQAEMVRNGVADIAFVNPILSSAPFPDDVVMQMPGLFKNTAEATSAYTSLTVSGALQGYDDFFVIGSVAILPMLISTKTQISTLDDLRGKRIGVTNVNDDVYRILGMAPVQTPIGQASLAISNGTMDGVASPPVALFDFGISRVTRYHFVTSLNAVPLTLLMSRKKFDGLPVAAQNAIRKSSGDWLARRFIDILEPENIASLERLKSETARKVIFPAKSELDAIQAASRLAIEKWLEKSPHNQAVFERTKATIAQLRLVQ